MASSPSLLRFSVHPASLVDPHLHSGDLIKLLNTPPHALLEHVVNFVIKTVDQCIPLTVKRASLDVRSLRIDAFATLAFTVLHRGGVPTAVLLVSLVYVERAKRYLHVALEQWALERVFLGAMIVAAKYINDECPDNKYWSQWTGLFGQKDIGRVEREFLDVLDYQLGLTEDDILVHFHGLINDTYPIYRRFPLLQTCSQVHRRAIISYNQNHHTPDPYNLSPEATATRDTIANHQHLSTDTSFVETPINVSFTDSIEKNTTEKNRVAVRNTTPHCAAVPARAASNTRKHSTRTGSRRRLRRSHRN
ncbi:hypothetical protein C8J57DRAFT_1619116 [Mycena rebaudengoi]|nr:hypothetical protein C8J57DRAFT_1619116 [Mycena rebaudengoi]